MGLNPPVELIPRQFVVRQFVFYDFDREGPHRVGTFSNSTVPFASSLQTSGT